ncbi:tetratricopeptide repeat protein [Helicobacter felis]|uniref:tetratricopeptide repeat protein n=2 Tax=Helicobacter felis TaxID=214 RepID=UPI001F4258FF|nr:tetratricopeptide repeat protein [Helicobacter felis]
MGEFWALNRTQDLKRKKMTRIAKNLLKIALVSLCCVASLFAHDNPTKAQQIKQYLSIANKAYDQQVYDKALKYFQKAADLGSVKGYIGLGNWYSDDDNVWRDCPKALRYYQKAAGMGSAEGYFKIGIMYEFECYDNYERAVVSDYAKALQYFKKAGDMGYAEGYYYAGAMYENGSLEGIPKDDVKAKQYFKKAANMGNADAYYGLARLYLSGRGVEHNEKKARQYYQKACNMGSKSACGFPEDF